MDRGEARVADHLLEHLDRVVADHPDIGEPFALNGV